jgi:putative FmdB family regulatory protein
MPIYEYRCSSCGHELEALQKFSDAPLRTCPSCKTDSLVKLMSAAGFQLKGSGWYATDFKGSGSKPAPTKVDGESASDAKSEGKGETKTEGKGETKTEGKSETKTEGKSDRKSEGKSETKSEAKTETKGGGTAPTSGTGAPPAPT